MVFEVAGLWRGKMAQLAPPRVGERVFKNGTKYQGLLWTHACCVGCHNLLALEHQLNRRSCGCPHSGRMCDAAFREPIPLRRRNEICSHRTATLVGRLLSGDRVFTL